MLELVLKWLILGAWAIILGATFYDAWGSLRMRNEDRAAADLRTRGRKIMLTGLATLSLAVIMVAGALACWLSPMDPGDFTADQIRLMRALTALAAIGSPAVFWYSVQRIQAGRSLMRAADRAARG